MSSARTMISIAVIAAVVLFAACDRHKGLVARGARLETSIDSLRIAGDFQEALTSANELLDLRRLDKRSRPYEVVDAEMLVSTLELIVTLPVKDQEDLARAYELKATWAERLCNFELDAEEARAAIQEQREIFTRILGPRHPDAAVEFGLMTGSALNDLALTEALSLEALGIYREALGPEHPKVAARLSNLAISRISKRDFAGADSLFREALHVYRTAIGADHPQVAMILINLAYMSARQNDRESCRALGREALKLYRKSMSRYNFDLAVALDDLANRLWRAGDTVGVLCLLRVAVAVHPERLGPSHDLVLFFVIEAAVEWIPASFTDHPDVGWALDQLASYLDFQRRDHDSAESVYRAALDVRRKILGPEHPDLALALNRVARMALDKGDYTEAETLYREALGINQKVLGSDHVRVAVSQSRIAGCLESTEDYAGAESLYRRAIEIYEKVLVEGHYAVGEEIDGLARCLYNAGHYARADSTYREALDAWRTGYGPEHRYVANSLRKYAQFLSRKGNHERAEEYLTQAASVYESSCRRTGFGTERSTYQESPYPALAIARLTIGKTGDAWQSVERGLGRSLADLLIAAESRPLSEVEAASEDSILSALTNLDGRVQGLSEAVIADPSPTTIAEYQELREDLIKLEAEWSSFQSRIRKKYPLTEGESYPLDKVRALLDNQTAIIGWLDVQEQEGPPGSWAYVIRKDGPVAWAQLQPSGDSLGCSAYEQTQRFRDHLAAPEWLSQIADSTAQSCLEQWRQRVAPISHALDGVTHLVVIPSGAMLGIPLEVLVDETGTYLGDCFSVSYTPSATIHTWLKERKKALERMRADESLLVGDPPFRSDQLTEMEEKEDALALCLAPRGQRADRSVLRSALAGNRDALSSLRRLPCTRLEIEGIAGLLPEPMILIGPRADERELLRLAEGDRLEDFSTIHVATHALVDQENPERSALVLSQVNLPDPLEAADKGERVCDGLVTAKEILREWRLDADLVVLSGCETALGKEIGGEGYVGLAHTFLQAGARSLIVSLWPVEDRATSLLMERFYENWTGRYSEIRNGHKGKKMSKTDALQEAKRYVRTYTENDGEMPFEHPYYWAAFILIGERQ